MGERVLQVFKNMIKGNSLGDTNKLYLTLHEAGGLHAKNFKTGWEAKSFVSINKRTSKRQIENV